MRFLQCDEGPAFRLKPLSTPIPIPSNGSIATHALPSPTFDDPKHHLRLYQGDCLEILAAIRENSVDLVFADPPYFLSNGGITCHAGKMAYILQRKKTGGILE